MNERLNGWIDRLMDAWMDEYVDLMGRCMDGYMLGCISGSMDGSTDRQTLGWTDERSNGQTVGPQLSRNIIQARWRVGRRQLDICSRFLFLFQMTFLFQAKYVFV